MVKKIHPLSHAIEDLKKKHGDNILEVEGEEAEYSMRIKSTVLLQVSGELKEAGFDKAADHGSGDSPPPLPLGDAPSDTVVMGDDMPVRGDNAKAAVIDGRLVPMMVTARRPT